MKKRLFFSLICLFFNNCRLPSDSIIAGCMDESAVNYNIDATLDDCSCNFNNEEFDCFQVSSGSEYYEFYTNNIQFGYPLISANNDYCNKFDISSTGDTLLLNFYRESVCRDSEGTIIELVEQTETLCMDNCGYWIDSFCPHNIYIKTNETIYPPGLIGNWGWHETRHYSSCFENDYEINNNSNIFSQNITFYGDSETSNGTFEIDLSIDENPSNFVGTWEINTIPLDTLSIISHLFYNTGGNCLDLDVDIQDSVLVAVANYNGYFIYKIHSTSGIISDIAEQKHIGANEMDPNLGDNRAQSVILSKEHDIAFVMDQYDHIWLYKYEDGVTQYDMPNYLEEDCYGSTWISVAIDDQKDSIRVYTLLKHNAAEDEAADFLEYSTSLVWSNLKGVDPSSTSPDQDDPNCEFIINQGIIADKIYFDDGLLSMGYGELGVRVFKQTEFEVCLTDTGFIDLNDSELCIENYNNSGDVDYNSCCENTACPGGMGECLWIIEDGFGGVFSSAGGIIPKIHAEFDTPGEVEAVFSESNTIFAGLKYSNGCVMSILDNDGSVISTHQFAIGHTIKGIHHDSGLLALAAGHDGILLYNWNGSNVSFMGKIETSYANNVKVAGDIIFVATEDGIEVIQIDFTPYSP